MKRNFEDWLTAYADYAQDSFCPPKFHFWTGVSAVAGALERKVWTQLETFKLYPNAYILLVARPGVGKSSAMNMGIDMLKQLKSDAGEINFLATQNSEASFNNQMTCWKTFFVGDVTHTQSAGYFYASEASNSLKEIPGGGDITSALTEFYDCPPYWRKNLVAKDIEVKNACCNVLAGSTFSFLNELIPQQKVEGGFASRLLYVIQDDLFKRNPKWSPQGKDLERREALISDLQRVYSLTGTFKPTPEIIKTFEEWFPLQDEYAQGLKSARMQHFIARKHTNILKLAMICSAAESDDLILDVRHWERAKFLVEEVESNLSKIIDHSVNKQTQQGLNHTILNALAKEGKEGVLERPALMASLMRHHVDQTKIESTINFMHNSGVIKIEMGGAGKMRYRLLVDAKDYF